MQNLSLPTNPSSHYDADGNLWICINSDTVENTVESLIDRLDLQGRVECGLRQFVLEFVARHLDEALCYYHQSDYSDLLREHQDFYGDFDAAVQHGRVRLLTPDHAANTALMP